MTVDSLLEATKPQIKPTDLGVSPTIHIHHYHLLLLLSLKAGTHFTVPQMVED